MTCTATHLRVVLRLAGDEATAKGGHFGLPLGTKGENQYLLIDLLVSGEAAPLATTCCRHVLICPLRFEIEVRHQVMLRRLLIKPAVILLNEAFVFLDGYVHRVENTILGAQFADFFERG